MSYRVVIHGNASHQIEAGVAFKAGLARHGIDALMVEDSAPRECDLAVFWGHRKTQIMAQQRAAGRFYLVMERGYVADRFEWTSLGFNGLNGRATWPEIDDGGARWRTHFAGLMAELRTAEERLAGGRKGYVLVAGQVTGDASLVNVDFEKWLTTTVATLRGRFSAPIVFRPHPLATARGQPAPHVPGAMMLEGELADALADAAWCVTFNSNIGVDAVLAGVPTVTCDEGAMAWPVTGHEPASIPRGYDRSRWAHALAWRQWRLEEIEAGAAWDALKTVLERELAA